jgi:hypothetical protein
MPTPSLSHDKDFGTVSPIGTPEHEFIFNVPESFEPEI